MSIPDYLIRTLCLVAVVSTAEAAGVSGAIFTTTVDGSAVNANIYDSKCAVYLDGGPGPHAPATAAGLPDGDYYFQVTDPSGAQLLSTDPVSNRRFHVSGGLITAFSGSGGPAHPTGIDQDHGAQGAITIRLANTNCPGDFANSPNVGNVYKVWATPVGSFTGNPMNVDSPCGNGCFHGFLASQSKTDNFKAQPGAAATFCLTLSKQQLNSNGTLSPLGGWTFQVTDPNGVVNSYTTASTAGTNSVVGQISACQLVPGTYAVSEDVTQPPFTPPLRSGCSVDATITVNSLPPIKSTTTSFTWDFTQPSTMSVSFVNELLCLG